MYRDETIAGLQRECHEISKAKGWYDCLTCRGSGDGLEGGFTCGECAGTGLRNRNVMEMLCLVHTELSEAAEFYRKNNEGWSMNDIFLHGYRNNQRDWVVVVDRKAGVPKPDGFAIELADFVIRMCDIAEYKKLDLEKSIVEALECEEFVNELDRMFKDRTSDGSKGNVNILEILCLIHRDISRATEFYHNNTSDWPINAICFGFALTRIQNLAQFLKIDLAMAIRKKIEFNKLRAYRHGNKRA